jgi:toxin CptA
LIRIRLSPSPTLAALLVAMHAAAAACALAYLPGWWAAALTAALVASLAFHLRRDALLRARDAVVELAVGDAGRCELGTRGGEVLEGRVLGSSVVSPLLIVVNVGLDAGRAHKSVVVMPDSAPAEDLRELRVWLRYRARPAAPGSGVP